MSGHRKLPGRPSTVPVQRASSQVLQRCGGTVCAPGTCDHDGTAQLQRQPAAPSASPSTVPPIVHDVLRSSGRPLDDHTRAFMESLLGHDFSQVRVHTDARAAASAQIVNARAYTVGTNVVFNEGGFAPDTAGGRSLLAHELTHVVQQAGTAGTYGSSVRLGPVDDPAEHEASHVAARLMANPQLGHTPAIVPTRPVLARQAEAKPKSKMQCINGLLSNAGVPWAVLAILSGVCGLIGVLVTSPSGPGAAAGGVGAAAVCIAIATGLTVGMVTGIILRCIQDTSSEWIFAQAGGDATAPAAPDASPAAAPAATAAA
jgi:hypothetical protein